MEATVAGSIISSIWSCDFSSFVLLSGEDGFTSSLQGFCGDYHSRRLRSKVKSLSKAIMGACQEAAGNLWSTGP